MFWFHCKFLWAASWRKPKIYGCRSCKRWRKHDCTRVPAICTVFLAILVFNFNIFASFSTLKINLNIKKVYHFINSNWLTWLLPTFIFRFEGSHMFKIYTLQIRIRLISLPSRSEYYCYSLCQSLVSVLQNWSMRTIIV